MFYNCHIHTFTDEDVPDRYLPLALARMLKTRAGSALLTRGLHSLIPFTQRDLFDKYARFIEIGKMRSQERIFYECARFYPDDTRFFVHAMDMRFMEAGRTSRSYEDQLEELGRLALKDQRVLPFMMVDPRRKGVLELLKRMHQNYGFSGIKIYPPLGYFPGDRRLEPVYLYCTENRLPVMAHCGPYNPTYFRGSRKDLLELLKEAPHPLDPEGQSAADLCTWFTHPRNYPELLGRFPDLRICLAHFGGSYYWERYIRHPENPDNWFSLIRKLIAEHPGLYTDVSFTLSYSSYFSLLKVILADEKIRKKVLFGSDFYMVRTKTEERRFGLDLRAFIGESYFHDLAVANPADYLARP